METKAYFLSTMKANFLSTIKLTQLNHYQYQIATSKINHWLFFFFHCEQFRQIADLGALQSIPIQYISQVIDIVNTNVFYTILSISKITAISTIHVDHINMRQIYQNALNNGITNAIQQRTGKTLVIASHSSKLKNDQRKIIMLLYLQYHMLNISNCQLKRWFRHLRFPW